MANVEIDEAQLQQMQHTVKTVAQIIQDPKRRLKLLELQKEAMPTAVIPELDAQRGSEEVLQSINKKMDEFMKAQAEREEKREADARLAEFTGRIEKGRSLLKSRGFDADGIAAVEKIMEERGIANHEDAMTVWERLHPTPTPISSSGFGGLNFLEQAKKQGEDDMAKLLASRGDNDLVLNNMINAAINEGRAA